MKHKNDSMVVQPTSVDGNKTEHSKSSMRREGSAATRVELKHEQAQVWIDLLAWVAMMAEEKQRNPGARCAPSITRKITCVDQPPSLGGGKKLSATALGALRCKQTRTSSSVCRHTSVGGNNGKRSRAKCESGCVAKEESDNCWG